MVKIRLARHGSKKRPFYHIVVANSRSPRDGRFIERIGSYEPGKNMLAVDEEAAANWLSKGAQPSETVHRLLLRAGIEAGKEAAATAEAAPAA